MTRDALGHWMGANGDGCEHRTVGAHRAWCLTCQTWCYPPTPSPEAMCPRCAVRSLVDENAKLRTLCVRALTETDSNEQGEPWWKAMNEEMSRT